jgi:hypothetical protein
MNAADYSNARSVSHLIAALAWVGMLLASTLPALIWAKISQEGAGDPLWLPASIGLQVGALALLLLVALLWLPARPLRLPLIMLLTFLVGWRVLTPLVTQRAGWAEWQASQTIGVSLATSRLQWVPPAALMTLVAVAAGLGRVRLFLTKGDWSAPVVPEPLFPLRRWRWFPGMFVLVLLLGILPLVLGEFVLGMPGWVSALGPDFGKADRVLSHSLGILAASVLNAAFVHEQKITWRVWWDGKDGAIAKGWRVSSYPSIYVLDPKGTIRYKNIGGKALEEAVEKLLSEMK